MDHEGRGRRGGSRTAPTNSAGGRGLVAADYGVAWVTHGLMVPCSGFVSIPRGGPGSHVLVAFMAVLMRRNSSRGCLARPESAPRSRQGHSPAHTNKSLLAALNLLVAPIHLSSGKALCRKPVSEQA